MRTLHAIHLHGPPTRSELTRHHDNRELERMQRRTLLKRIPGTPEPFYILGYHGRAAIGLHPEARPPGTNALAQQRTRGAIIRHLEHLGYTLERHVSGFTSLLRTAEGAHLYAIVNHNGYHRRSFHKRFHTKLLNLIHLPRTHVVIFDPDPDLLRRVAGENTRFVAIEPIPPDPPPWRPTPP